MSVSRTTSRSRRAGGASAAASAARGTQETEVSRRLDAIVTGLRSADPATRDRARAELRAAVEPRPGPYRFDRELFAAFREEVDRGRLRDVPEAHFEVARHLIEEEGDGAAGRRSLWRAIHSAARLAESDRPADRARAQWINRWSGPLFSRLGDAVQARARYEISRLYSVTSSHRATSLPVSRAEPVGGQPEASVRREPAMGAYRAAVPVPGELTRKLREPPPPVPPVMEQRPVYVLNLLELAIQLGAHARMHRLSKTVSRYIEEVDRRAFDRDFLAPPPRPHVVRELERQRDPPLRGIDFNLLMEAARAYWGPE